MSPAVRNAVLFVHRWTGLTVGLVFVMLAVTAAILVFRDQVEPVVSPALFAVGQCKTEAPLDTGVANALRAHPGGKLDDIRIRGGGLGGEPTQVRFLDRTLVHVDPCTGQVMGEQNKYGGLFGFPEQLHRFKFMQPEAGAITGGIITLIVLVLLVVGGVVVWWPATRMALKGAFKFRPHLKGVAFELNLHNIIGIYTAIVLVITAATALPISFSWLRESLYSMTSSQRITKPVAVAVPGAKPLPLEAQWQRVKAAFPPAQEAVIRFPRKPTDAVEAFTVNADAAHPNARNYIYLDPVTGSVLKSIPYAESPTGLRIYFWLVSLHTGAVGGPIVQLLFLLGMLGVPVLAYTGFSSYLRRRFQRKAEAAIDVRVAAIQDETEEIKSYRLAPLGGKALPPFTPGAHISVQVREGITRQYSLCNAPNDTTAYHIAVKREPESRGGSRALHERVAEGDVLAIAAPRNHFPLDSAAKHHVLLAGGIGITPLLSMVHHLQATGASFELKYFTRSIRHTAFHEVLSNPELSGKVDFHYALDPESLRKYLHKLLQHRPEGAHLYACGPRPFMNLVEEIASASWPDETIHMEFFSADPLASSGPRAPFEIKLARTQAVYQVPAEKTILEVLAEHGIAITTSCGQGVCGTCITGVLEGEPDHRDAFLSDKERKACDKMMLCVSRAKSERLTLDL
jgi:vanillate O-demethylase ferredoxin subunit